MPAYKPTSYETVLWQLANVKVDRHPFGPCMTLGLPMIDKIRHSSSASAFFTSDGIPVGGEAAPQGGGSSTGRAEFRHGHPNQTINGWDPNGEVPWICQAPPHEIGSGAHLLCDALITHVTDFGAIGIDL